MTQKLFCIASITSDAQDANLSTTGDVDLDHLVMWLYARLFISNLKLTSYFVERILRILLTSCSSSNSTHQHHWQPCLNKSPLWQLLNGASYFRYSFYIHNLAFCFMKDVSVIYSSIPPHPIFSSFILEENSFRFITIRYFQFGILESVLQTL